MQEELAHKQRLEEERQLKLQQLKYDFKRNDYTYDFEGNLVQVQKVNLTRLPHQTKQLIKFDLKEAIGEIPI